MRLLSPERIRGKKTAARADRPRSLTNQMLSAVGAIGKWFRFDHRSKPNSHRNCPGRAGSFVVWLKEQSDYQERCPTMNDQYPRNSIKPPGNGKRDMSGFSFCVDPDAPVRDCSFTNRQPRLLALSRSHTAGTCFSIKASYPIQIQLAKIKRWEKPSAYYGLARKCASS